MPAAAHREAAPSLLAPLGQRMMDAPFDAPAQAQALADAYALAPTSLASLYATSLARIHDEPVAVPTLSPGPLAAEVVRARALAGETTSAAEAAALAARSAKLEPNVERALATLVAAATQARLADRDAFAHTTRADVAFFATHHVGSVDMRPGDAAQLLSDASPTDLLAARDAISRIDTGALHRAQLAMAVGVDDAAALLRDGSPRASMGQVFETDTPYGRIRVQGTGSDVYAAGDDFFVLVDLGGDDRYENRAGGSTADLLGTTGVPFPPSPTDPTFPAWLDAAYGYVHRAHNASVVIDVGGNDVYASAAWGAQGFGAYGGFGALVDLAGNDLYSAPGLAQGAGQVGGAGFLVDAAGNDMYAATEQAQGFGIDAGGGFLAEADGADQYTSEVVSQGTGYSADLVGLLVDVAGSDVYSCTGERDFSGSILPVNAPRPGTICHAAGFGGTGVQVDLAGDDDYLTASSFQALTLIGTGILVDGAGNDEYRAGEWSNGVGVVGAAVIVDGAGDDVYASDHRLLMPWSDIYLGSNGEGYEGVGILADASGNDDHEASARKDLWLTQYACSAGCAYELGVGLLLDGAGDDRYVSEVGQGGAVYGVAALVDSGGNDVYTLTQGSTRGQGYAGEEHVFVLDDGVSDCWYGVLIDLDGTDAYSNPVTDFGSRVDGGHWGQGAMGRGADSLGGVEAYANGELFGDLQHELNTHACNQLGV